MDFEAFTLSRLGFKENWGVDFCCAQAFVAQRGVKNRRKNTHIFSFLPHQHNYKSQNLRHNDKSQIPTSPMALSRRLEQ